MTEKKLPERVVVQEPWWLIILIALMLLGWSWGRKGVMDNYQHHTKVIWRAD